MTDAPTSLAKDLVLVAIRARLGHSLRVVNKTPRHKIRVIVRLGWRLTL